VCRAQARGFAIRNGHCYARRLVEALAPAILPHLRRGEGQQQQQPQPPSPPPPPQQQQQQQQQQEEEEEGALSEDVTQGGAAEAFIEDGVVRISLLHYNSPAEVDGLLAALRDIL
jgi:selenocysteine lyase/cysteine desulfurase